jgi:L-alanine-DL-glutamate epimerase-like enolase superfamily enzyme
MRITELTTTVLEIPWTDPPRWSHDYSRLRELVVVDVKTDEGLTGMGYLMPLFGGAATIAACLREMIAPAVIGEEGSNIEGIWRDLYRRTYEVGRMGVVLFAISALDIALWDLLGKKAGMPLFRLWGGISRPLPAYGSGCWRGLGREGMAEKAKAYLAKGFTAIKMQCGHIYTGDEDAANLRFMRDSLGPEVSIMTDANMAWTADEAIQTGLKLQAYDLYWLEEPVAAEDFKGYIRVANALTTRVVGGETHFTRYDLRPFLEDPCLPVLQPDVMRGGLTDLRKVAVLADTWGMKIAPHLFHELMVHINASIANPGHLEYVNFLDDLWEEPVLPVNGCLIPPERPGHGLKFREEVLRDYVKKT